MSNSAPIAIDRPRVASGRAPGFTLVELLVVMAIIAILAGLVLGALYASAEAARRENTQALINKLHNRMMLRYETYATRRVPMDPTIACPGDSLLGDANSDPESRLGVVSIATGDEAQGYNIALRRLWGMRELMRIELPDQYSDLFCEVQFIAYQLDPSTGLRMPANGLWSSYRARISEGINALLNAGHPDAPDADAAWTKIRRENQSAELLYMILTTPFGDEGQGAGSIATRDVGDTDGDGMPEFIDGWGNPIEWIRWPTAFISELQSSHNGLESADPFDARHIDARADGTPRGYRLMPLIMSAGPDGEPVHAQGDVADSFGMVFRWYGGADGSDWTGSTPPVYTNNGNYLRIDPFAVLPDATEDFARATLTGTGAHIDNIHNHYLQMP